MAQRMSVALHMAAAWEIARELSLAGASAPPYDRKPCARSRFAILSNLA